MQISDDTNHVINFIEDVFPDSIQNTNDLANILEIGALFGLHTQINELIFTATAIQYMKKRIISAPANDSSTEKMKIELQKSLQDFKEMLQNIKQIAKGNNLDVNFRSYLSENTSSVENLISISSDLALLKEVQNKMREKQK